MKLVRSVGVSGGVVEIYAKVNNFSYAKISQNEPIKGDSCKGPVTQGCDQVTTYVRPVKQPDRKESQIRRATSR